MHPVQMGVLSSVISVRSVVRSLTNPGERMTSDGGTDEGQEGQEGQGNPPNDHQESNNGAMRPPSEGRSEAPPPERTSSQGPSPGSLLVERVKALAQALEGS